MTTERPEMVLPLADAIQDPHYLSLVRQRKVMKAARYLAKRSGITLSIGLVITIFLIIILGAAILPTAFSQWFNANTTGWPVATQTLWPLVPLLAIVVVIAILAYKVASESGQGNI